MYKQMKIKTKKILQLSSK